MLSDSTLIHHDLASIYNLISILNKRREIFIFVTLTIFISASYFIMKQPIIYEASTKLYIGENISRNILSDQVYPYNNNINERNIETQIQIIKSNPIINRVIKTLNLADPEKEPEKFKNMANSIKKRLKVAQIPNTQLIKIDVTSSEAKQASDIANAIANVYIKRNFEKTIEHSREAISWLTEQIVDLKAKVEESEKNLLDYQEKEKLVISDVVDDKKNRGDELRDAFYKTQTELIETKTIIDNLKLVMNEKGEIQSIPSYISQTETLENLRLKLVETTFEYERLSSKYLPLHPKMQKLKNDIEILKENIKKEIEKVIKGMEAKYEVLKAKSENLEKALHLQDQQAININRKEIGYSILKREAETNKELYNVMIKKLKELDISSELVDNMVDIVEYAEIPTSPVRSNKALNLFIGFIAALALGVTSALGLEYFDRTIKTGEEATASYNLPILASLPKIVIKDKKDKRDKSYLIVYKNHLSTHAEAFKTLRTNIKLSTPSLQKRTWLITSTGAKEGKTTVSVNLGITMAQIKSKTLIVDTDLRKSTIHKYFNIPNEQGITNFLAGEIEEVEKLIYDTEYENLWVIPSGVHPPNPAELLDTDRMKNFVQYVSSKFDCVIFDSPPVSSVTDASILSSMVDCVLFILYAGKMDKSYIGLAINQLKKVNAKILGIVMNGIDYKTHGYPYYYHYYYSSYGEEKDKRDVNPFKGS